MTGTRLNTLQVSVIVLACATALVHLWLGVVQLSMGMGGGVMFLLNAIGYVGLVAALYGFVPIALLKQNRILVRWALVAFTVVTILGWIAIGTRNEIGYLTKVIEVVLIVLLVIEAREK
jgi:hypothetical protein